MDTEIASAAKLAALQASDNSMLDGQSDGMESTLDISNILFFNQNETILMERRQQVHLVNMGMLPAVTNRMMSQLKKTCFRSTTNTASKHAIHVFFKVTTMQQVVFMECWNNKMR